MSAIKVIAGAAAAGVLVLTVVTFVFWWGWLRAPSPEAVCAHAAEVLAGELGERSGAFRRECLRNVQPPQFGRLAYARAMHCVVAARCAAELKACKAAASERRGRGTSPGWSAAALQWSTQALDAD